MREENTPLLETKRLILRRFTDRDIEDMLLLYGDEEVNRFLPWFPLRTVEAVRSYLHSDIYADYEKESAYRYAMEDRETGRVVGYVTISGIDAEKTCGDLGYGLRKESWGRGLVEEASRAVLERLRENGFAYVTATHDVNNPRSGRVMDKLGMTYVRSYTEQWQPKDFSVVFRLYRIELSEGCTSDLERSLTAHV